MAKKLLRIFYLSLFALGIAGCLGGNVVGASSPTIEVLHVDGTIVPVVADYIERGITRAEEQGSIACIIELNTPGGLLDSTEEIVESILNSQVPIVAYVSPQGAWAGSAGTFITIAAHIAAMAPGTAIGAAHPVSGGGQEIPEEEAKKVTQFATEWIRSIAEMRGRNPDEAALAVSESKSFTDTEALKLGLIDLRADNLESLFSQLNGRKVILDGKEVILNTKGYEPIRNEMSEIERFLHAISDPNIAYLLLTLASVGLITEISNPGLIFPGVAGGISLILAFYSLGVLNAYWGGIFLILLGVGLLVAEIFTPTFGILTAGGVASLVFGSLILFSRSSPPMEVDRGLIAGVSTAATAFIVFAIGAIVRGQKRRKATGTEGMVGGVAIAKTSLAPTGTVLAEGELWKAMSEGDRIEPNEEVTITRVEGLKLWVAKKLKG
jgi:membrane-bound serine protease (ClpP class)